MYCIFHGRYDYALLQQVNRLWRDTGAKSERKTPFEELYIFIQVKL